MLAFAIASFFALALIGSVTVIGLMFFGYREKILDVLLEGLRPGHVSVHRWPATGADQGDQTTSGDCQEPRPAASSAFRCRLTFA